jgi:adenylate cyclase
MAAIIVLLVFAGGLIGWNIYLQQSKKVAPASVEKMAFPLPDKPSIAVLPFDNLSGNPEDESIADGISDSIITALSKTPKMFVISRNSTFTYKGKPVKVRQVSEEMGVRYVLEGSVQKSNDQLRINAQLIDAITGNHLWAEKYDRNIKDIFALQDEITMKIITALQVQLSEGEHANLVAGGTGNLEAYLKAIQAEKHWQRGNKEGDAMAQKLAKEAISLDPNFAAAYGLLSRTQWRSVMFRTTNSPKKTMGLSLENAKKAVSLDESSADALSALGWIYTMMRQHDKGIAAAERGLALDPNSSRAYSNLGLTLNSGGRCEEAIELFKKAIRLSPIPSANILFCACYAYRDCERYEEGISLAKKAIDLAPDSIFAHLCLASCYALSGRIDEARAEGAEVLRINPKYHMSRSGSGYKDPAYTERSRRAGRLAGIPE